MFSCKQGPTSGSNIAKGIFWWNHICNDYKASYKTYGSKELFCNNFGQEGTTGWTVGLFYLWSGFFTYGLVFVAYGKLAWSFLLTVEIRFGLSCLRWKFAFDFYFWFTPPIRKLRFGLFCLRSPSGWPFFKRPQQYVKKQDVFCCTFILSLSSHILDAKSRLNRQISAKIGKKSPTTLLRLN